MKILKVLPALIGTATVAATVLAVSSPAHALATWGINNLEFADGTGNGTFDVVNSGSTFQYDSNYTVGQTVSAPGAVNVVVDTSTNAQNNLFVNSTYAFNEYTVVQSTSSILKLEFENTSTSSSTDNLFVSFTNSSVNNLSDTTLSSTPSNTQVNASISTNTALTNLTLEGGGGNNSAYAVQAISPIAFTAGQGTATGGSTGVPFEVPGGATIPVFGSVLALGVMRKFGKNVKLGASVVDSGN